MNTKPEFRYRIWKPSKRLPVLRVGLLALCLLAIAVPAQTFSLVHSFGNVTGSRPLAPLVQSPDGTLYGTAFSGEGNVAGVVFRLKLDGTGFTALKYFTDAMDGKNPQGLVLSGSTLYGTTLWGGVSNAGTVFKLETSGSGYAVLKSFTGSDGRWPRGVVLSGSTLFGTTEAGGTSDYGTVFQVSTDGSGFQALKSFTYADGTRPRAGLVISGSTLYGTASSGGQAGCGTVFKLNSDGTGYSVLKHFLTTNGVPWADLILSGNTLYGTTCGNSSAASDYGAVFKINTDGSGFSVLKHCTWADGAFPQARLLLAGSTLYGTTSDGGRSGNDAYGTVFKVNTDGSGYNILRSFAGSDGDSPCAGLLLSGGTLYGTTQSGGSSGNGTVFKINTDGSGHAVLESFTRSDGTTPMTGVALAGDTLYGMTSTGGSVSNGGTLFSVNTDGTGYTLLRSMGGTDGIEPSSGVVLSGTTLYGATVRGGSSGKGTIFKINTDGSGFTVLTNFAGYWSYQAAPSSLLLSGGTLYGTTIYGGPPPASGFGTVFKVNTDGTGLTVLKNFTGTTWWGPGGLLLSGGTLYGITAYGGSSNRGTVFKLNPDGSGFTLLKEFDSSVCRYPAALVLSGTTLYGSAGGGSSGQGTIFKLNTDGTGFTVVRNLAGGDGTGPTAGLVLSNTTLYGTTSAGGSFNGGTLFQLETDGTGFVAVKHFGGGNGEMPWGALLLSGTTLYGTTRVGGDLGNGVVFSLAYDVPPNIVVAPQSQAVQAGSTVSFAVGAAGWGPLAYQWFYNGNSITGATTAVLQITNVQLAQAGPYSVRVTNNFGATTSAQAMLTVNGVAIATPPMSQTVLAGANVDLQVVAKGSPPFAYQWFFGLNAILDATNSVLHLPQVQTSQSGAYSVVVTNAHGSVTSSPAMLEVVALGTIPVVSCTEVGLRAALMGQGPVTFACDGTITLADTIAIATNATIDGSGHHITISGSNAVGVLYVETNVSLTLINLTIANGRSTNGGGGIHNAGGTVNATRCTFADNRAIGNPAGPPVNPGIGTSGQDAYGGAIYNLGILNADECVLVQNSALAGAGGDVWSYDAWTGGPGGTAAGGAICSFGALNIRRSTLTGNLAVGGAGGAGGGSTSQRGGVGGSGGWGRGGAIFSGGPGRVTDCALIGNTGSGGAGGRGGAGGAFIFTTAGGDGGTGGSGVGALGGFFSSVNCTVASNTAWGGNGGSGGPAGWIGHHASPGGNGARGGDGLGAIQTTGALTNCTIAFNSSIAGTGGEGGSGQPYGATGGNGAASGAISSGGLLNTLLVTTAPGSNCSGTITDLGHNLSSDGSCAFTNVGSLNNTDARLGPLANNGGPTLTMALFPFSPAIDAGDNVSAPKTDQRGFPRPAGLAADIGAFEFGSMLTVLAISRSGATGINILVNGNANQWCRLLTSTNLLNWQCVATNQIGADGTVLFQDNCGAGASQRFYRVALP